MSVKRATTVSIAPLSTSAFSSSSVSMAATLPRRAFTRLQRPPEGVRFAHPPRAEWAAAPPTERREDRMASSAAPPTHLTDDETAAPPPRVQAGALPGDERLQQLLDQLHDHLDPRGLPDLVLPRFPVGRSGRRDLGLDRRRNRYDVRCALDGGDRVDVPDCWRPVLLVVETRERRLGLVHRLVQPHRADRDHRGRRVRPRDLRDGPFQPALAIPERPSTTSSISSPRS